MKSIIYEAYARLRDPVHGCTTAISYLQSCIEELQGQLKETERLLLESQEQKNQLNSILNEQFAPSKDELCGGIGGEDDLLDENLIFLNSGSGFDMDLL